MEKSLELTGKPRSLLAMKHSLRQWKLSYMNQNRNSEKEKAISVRW